MTMLLTLVMTAVFIQSSQAVKCYKCQDCDSPTSETCTGELCVKGVGEYQGAL